MAEPDHVRLEIGFDGGQIVGAFVTSVSADQLEQAIESSREGGITIATEDGRYTIRLDKVVYVKRFDRESRLGFGSP